MSDIRARYIGHPDGIEDFRVPVGTEGEQRRVNIPHGGELPTAIDGLKVPASFRDSLLEQSDNWTKVQRKPTSTATTSTTTSAAKADEKKEA